MDMKPAVIVDKLATAGIHVQPDAGQLKVVSRIPLTDTQRDWLRQQKQSLLAYLTSGSSDTESLDWNRTPEPSAADVLFNQPHIDAIKAGQPVQVWSSVLGEWLWWVRDEDGRQALLQQGCELPIYTLGELAVVAGWGTEALREVHAFKREMGATIEPPVCGDSGQE